MSFKALSCGFQALRALALVVVSAALTSTVWAHGSAHESAAQHGGVMAQANDQGYELVVQPTHITLYVSDHGAPVVTAGGSAMLTLLQGAEKVEVPLSPAGGNQFVAQGSFKFAPGAKAVALVRVPGQKAANVRFVLK